MSGSWVVAGWAGVAYGVYLTVLALRSPPGTELTGHWIMQPPFKALMALLLTVAAVGHPIVRERRWLMAALLLSAAGDWLLAIPWWTLSFVAGLGAFMLAHLCFAAALLPLARSARPSAPRIAIAVLVCLSTAVLLVWFWPRLSRDDLTLPVTVYTAVLTAMVCAAQFARLPTIWSAVGALCFAASDSMIGIGRFVLHNEALAVPIWWSYAAAEMLLTAGFFFGRGEAVDAWGNAAGVVDWPAERAD